jgi:hypothetical protein
MGEPAFVAAIRLPSPEAFRTSIFRATVFLTNPE